MVVVGAIGSVHHPARGKPVEPEVRAVVLSVGTAAIVVGVAPGRLYLYFDKRRDIR